MLITEDQAKNEKKRHCTVIWRIELADGVKNVNI